MREHSRERRLSAATFSENTENHTATIAGEAKIATLLHYASMRHMVHSHKVHKSSCHSAADFEELLQHARLRVTPRRIAVLRAFHVHGRMSAEEIAASNEASGMNRVTVYRIVQELVAAGILVPAMSEHAGVHYELHDHHTHTISCVRCGFIETLPTCIGTAADRAAVDASERFSVIERHSMAFFGTCARCARSS